MTEQFGISQAARKVPCPEAGLRRLDKMGVVHPVRDEWGRRLFSPTDIEAARAYYARLRGVQAA